MCVVAQPDVRGEIVQPSCLWRCDRLTLAHAQLGALRVEALAFSTLQTSPQEAPDGSSHIYAGRIFAQKLAILGLRMVLGLVWGILFILS